MLDYDPDTQTLEEIIPQIIDEHNRQQSAGANLQRLDLIAYNQKTLQFVPADRGIPKLLFTHNLGYAPLFIVYFGLLANNGIFDMPVPDLISGTSPMTVAGSINAFVDNTNLWLLFNDQLPTPSQTFTFMVFATPIPGN